MYDILSTTVMNRLQNYPVRFKQALLLVGAIACITLVSGKTRWSSLHIVPDADMFGSGEFTVGYEAYVSRDTARTTVFNSSFPIKFGLIEWVNLDLNYCGGMSVGLKARILGETKNVLPSLAIGVHNLFNHREKHYFYVDTVDDDLNAELYLALSKGIEPIKTRIHVGFQSIPSSKRDKITPFAAVEKYFGFGLYTTFEYYRRQREDNFSLFATWRTFNKHLEVTLGAVDLKQMFVDEDKKFAVSLTQSEPDAFIKPGVWIGIKYHGRFGLGKNKGFISSEDRLRKQDETIETLIKEVNDLKTRLTKTSSALDSTRHSLGILIDSTENDPKKLKNIIFAKLVALKTLYNSEPFEPDKVNLLIREIASYRGKATPCLEDFLVDKKIDRYVRSYSAAMLGIIGNKGSSDLLLDVLARTTDPDLKIEILIALGKMKETRAMFLMEQLANAPNDAVAITAQEVLLRLSSETGAEISPTLKMRKIEVDENKVLTPTKSVRPVDTVTEVKPEKVIEEKSTPLGDTVPITESSELPEPEPTADSLSADLDTTISEDTTATDESEENVTESSEEESAVEEAEDSKKEEKKKRKDKKRDKKLKKADEEEEPKKSRRDKKKDKKEDKKERGRNKDKSTKEERKKRQKDDKEW